MGTHELTDAELLVLGLVAEMPRHGYELEQEIGAARHARMDADRVLLDLFRARQAGKRPDPFDSA